MKRLMTFAAAALAAGPAMAHEGVHMHPHGAESALALIFAVALIAVAGLIAWSRR